MKCHKTLNVCVGAKGEGMLLASLQGRRPWEGGILFGMDVTCITSLWPARRSAVQERQRGQEVVCAVRKPGPEGHGRTANLLMEPRFILIES